MNISNLIGYIGKYLWSLPKIERDANEPLRLRPHHIGSLYSYYNGDFKDEKDAEFLIRSGDNLVQKLEEIGKNRDQLVRIVSGTDDICEECFCYDLCKRKKYKQVSKIKNTIIREVYGWDSVQEVNPDVVDQDVADLLDISPGQEYQLSDLLAKWGEKGKYLLNIKQIRAIRKIAKSIGLENTGEYE